MIDVIIDVYATPLDKKGDIKGSRRQVFWLTAINDKEPMLKVKLCSR